MSEHLLKIALTELVMVRIACQGKSGSDACGAVLELPLSALDTLHKNVPQCPLCKTSFGLFLTMGAGTAQDGFAPLAKAITQLNTARQQFAVEFIMPSKE